MSIYLDRLNRGTFRLTDTRGLVRFYHERWWHHRGRRWRAAALPWITHSAFIRAQVERLEHRLLKIKRGTTLRVRTNLVGFGCVYSAAVALVVEREGGERVVHPSTLRSLDQRCWDCTDDPELDLYIAPGVIVAPRNTVTKNALHRLMQEEASAMQLSETPWPKQATRGRFRSTDS